MRDTSSPRSPALGPHEVSGGGAPESSGQRHHLPAGLWHSLPAGWALTWEASRRASARAVRPPGNFTWPWRVATDRQLLDDGLRRLMGAPEGRAVLTLEDFLSYIHEGDRGAVRGAILRLGHEGLVSRERNRGARVRRFTLEEAVEILEARAALESLAAGYAALRRTDDEAAELQALVAEMERLQAAGELLAMSERNAVMHRRILEISRHEVAHDICARLHSQVARF